MVLRDVLWTSKNNFWRDVAVASLYDSVLVIHKIHYNIFLFTLDWFIWGKPFVISWGHSNSPWAKGSMWQGPEDFCGKPVPTASHEPLSHFGRRSSSLQMMQPRLQADILNTVSWGRSGQYYSTLELLTYRNCSIINVYY